MTNDQINQLPTIGARVKAQRAKLRAQGRKYAGLCVINETRPNDGAEFFKAGFRQMWIVIGNLEAQPADAFRTFTNLNDEVVVAQTRWLPFFHLI